MDNTEPENSSDRKNNESVAWHFPEEINTETTKTSTAKPQESRIAANESELTADPESKTVESVAERIVQSFVFGFLAALPLLIIGMIIGFRHVDVPASSGVNNFQHALTVLDNLIFFGAMAYRFIKLTPK